MLSLDQLKRILDEADFIYHAGGTGGEYVCKNIVEKNTNYLKEENSMPKFSNFWAENNGRWIYKVPFVQRSLGKIGMESWNLDHRFTDIKDLYHCYEEQVMRQANENLTNKKYNIPNDKKILIGGGHQPFKGIENFVDDDRLTHIRFKSHKHNTYAKVMSFLKVQASPIYCDGKYLIEMFNKNYTYLTRSKMHHEYKDNWDSDCIPKNIFLNRLQEVVSSGNEIYAFFGMVHLQPWRFNKNFTWKDIVKIPTKELNTLKWLVDNSEEFERILDKLNSPDLIYTPDQYQYYEGHGKYYCLSELLYEDDFGDRFGVDIKEDMNDWHINNMQFVTNMEQKLGYSLNISL